MQVQTSSFRIMLSYELALALPLLSLLLPPSVSASDDLTTRTSEFLEGPKLRPYHNPIISGFAPDPSCIRVDEQYFCVTSSFSAFPGIPVYTSRDLVQWQQIGKSTYTFQRVSSVILPVAGNVLSRPEQLPSLALVNQTTGGIWAATIREHKSIFYVTSTLVFDGAPQLSPSRWDNVRCAQWLFSSVISSRISLAYLPYK